jgi:flagellar hook assembly protein FlgD
VRRLSGVQPVDVKVFDLSGRLVRTLSVQRPTVAGTYSIEWLADDDRGRVVPPGIYVLRINVDADSNSAVKQTGVQRLLYVAY